MPYIPSEFRGTFDEHLECLLDHLSPLECPPRNLAGRLNYVITSLILRLIERQDGCYAVLNEMIGVLECCKLELYRRLLVLHEDRAIERNGDVF